MLLSPVDYNLHGLAGVRLIGATAADEAAVRRQLGPIAGPFEGEPDIVIRFVDRLAVKSPIRLLGVDDAGFTDDAFLILRSKHKCPARVHIPLEQVGKRCEIVCERGLPAVPLLIAIVNATVLGKGAIPLHASAFTYGGTGVLVTGWAKGGKTETLLAFMAHGARYIGDEWVYLTANGRRMYGIPEPIRLWDWHLTDLPAVRGRIGRKDRMRMSLLKLAVGSISWGASNRVVKRLLPAAGMRRLAALLKQQQHVQVPPERLFGPEATARSASPDVVLFTASHESPEIRVEPISSEEIARRMVFSLQEEMAPLWAYYLKFRFAFPELCSEIIERSEGLQREALRRTLAGKKAYAVYHPYPVPIPAVFEAVQPLLENCGHKQVEVPVPSH